MVLLAAGFAFPWYHISVEDNNFLSTTDYYFNARYITKNVELRQPKSESETDLKWSAYELPKVHSVFNTGLALAALSFIFAFASIVLIILIQFEYFKTVFGFSSWFTVRILNCLIFILIFIAVMMFISLPGSFKEDEKNFDTVTPTNQFIYCIDACDKKFNGKYSSTAVDVQYKPYLGWILTVISGVTALASAIISWVLTDSNIIDPV
ncbi:hypothetical protein DLAC_10177 [Tieghemostelium lacteum]|uniref:Transmembrane protein n=1 Tax=Tieghemostelium lacteum TaxID=361077 RepID=A0A151Z6B0_TIELA|nr:hypothetical protein DLAC_10177 [Tieghemostelium lacteum]|eukprot:KYQ89501.1 hypothetical protein DLAC_10177 [Tieghemostelium lacteum]